MLHTTYCFTLNFSKEAVYTAQYAVISTLVFLSELSHCMLSLGAVTEVLYGAP